jgi:hypothetical protein
MGNHAHNLNYSAWQYYAILIWRVDIYLNIISNNSIKDNEKYKKPNTILFPYYFYILDNKNLNIFNFDYYLFIFYLIYIQSFIIKLKTLF